MDRTRDRRAGRRALAALLVVGLTVIAPASAHAAGVTFVQQVNKRAAAPSVALQPTANITSGNRLVVEVGVWSGGAATASTVTDSAGNTYTKLTSFKASDNTELSIWSAPVTAGGGTRPTITVTGSASADLGAAVLEYSGLSTAAGTAAMDQMAHATATSSSAATVSSGPTPATTAAGELAIGFYVDSGFGRTLAADSSYTSRVNVSPTSDMEFVVQDQVLGGAGATPNPTTSTGANTVWLAATVVLKTGAPAPPPTAPGTPAAPSATAGDGNATLSWAAPPDGGSTITSYTVTPYAGSTALTPKVVSGSPLTTSTTVTGLTNGTAYTFTVKATNAVGSSAESAASNIVTPAPVTASPVAFVQQVSKRAVAASVALQPASNVVAGNRILVETGTWSSAGATISSVTDSSGNSYTKLTSFKAVDNTEMTVWSAPITAGGGSRPTITVTATGSADIGVAALEYSGLSTATGTGVLDQLKTASATTGAAANVSSGATAPSTAGGELAIGFYADSGFGNALVGDATFTTRTNVSPASDMELLAQDRILTASGSTANPTTRTGASTPWLAATLVLKGAASSSAPTAPSAPSGVVATAGNGQVSVNWVAPGDGGSPISSYTVTPYAGSTALTPKVVSGSPPATTTTVTGLTNGTAYTFTVLATNAVGSGPPSAPSNAATPAATSNGQWGTLMNWPMVAVHSVLLKNGNLLIWDGWQAPQPTTVWDPLTQTFPTTLNAPGSIFCGGNAHLPDGRIISVGGDGTFTTGNLGLADTAIFDPATSTWKRVADMKKPRWYPTLTQLADGRFIAISGNSTNASTWADNPEVYDPQTDTWTLLNGVNTSQVHEEEYPFSYLMPSGKIFTIGPSEDKSFLLDVNNQTWTPTGGASGVLNGSSVMYRPGKILYSGGAPSIASTTTANATTATIDLTGASPAWQQRSSMNHARIYHTLTMLADGTVLAVGGEQSSDQSIVTSGVLPAEIWDPSTQAWTDVAPVAAARNYHSTAVLMPDGRVLSAGGGHYNGGGGPGQFSAQYYSPPYLLKGARPTITSAAPAASYGSAFTVSTPDAASIQSVNLVSLGADTHQADMDQHFVPLTFTAGAGSLTVQAPASAALAPAGTYMLFIVNANGVPSVASMVSMSASLSAPSTPAAPTATAGNGQATVSWTAPNDGGSAITSYTVTPYIGSAPQPGTVVTGSPAPTTAAIGGLTNGTSYTFTVTATNALGNSPPSAASNAVTPASGAAATPAFVQKISGRVAAKTLTLQLPGAVTLGDRIVVQTAMWGSGGPTAQTVTDTAGNTYTKLTSFKASDTTEMSIWTAPITAGGATKPTVTVTATASADVGASVLEYSGLAADAGAAVVDQLKTATGTTGSATSTPVSSGATAATTTAGALALGFYADSGFGDNLVGDATYSTRVNVSPTSDIEMLVEDRALGAAGSTANAITTTGKSTPWLAATVVFKAAPVAPPAGFAARMGAADTPTMLGASPKSTAPASRVYAFDTPPLVTVLPNGDLIFCPLGTFGHGRVQAPHAAARKPLAALRTRVRVAAARRHAAKRRGATRAGGRRVSVDRSDSL